MTVLAPDRRRLLIAGMAALAGPRLAFADGPARVQVLIEDLDFAPEVAEARVGDTIEWVNNDPFDHTATVDGSWDVMIPAGETARHVVTAEDDGIGYYCRFHPNMTGQIRVIP